MLLSGEIRRGDFGARAGCLRQRRRQDRAAVFRTNRKDEAAYHAATGIYPIMHVIAMRRAVFRAPPLGGD